MYVDALVVVPVVLGGDDAVADEDHVRRIEDGVRVLRPGDHHKVVGHREAEAQSRRRR